MDSFRVILQSVMTGLAEHVAALPISVCVLLERLEMEKLENLSDSYSADNVILQVSLIVWVVQEEEVLVWGALVALLTNLGALSVLQVLFTALCYIPFLRVQISTCYICKIIKCKLLN